MSKEQLTAEQIAQHKQFTAPATQEFKEAIVKTAAERIGIDMQEILDISGYTPSDIQDTMIMKIIDGELYTGEFQLHLYNMLAKINVRLGNKAYKYAELDDSSDDLAIDADNSMEDFNGEYVPEFEEIYKLDTPFHKKAKVPGYTLSNAWAAAEAMVEFVQLQVESMTKAYARRLENMAWTTYFAQATPIEVANGAEAIEFNKELERTLLGLRTTSNTHEVIGTDGVITISTAAGDQTVQPDLYFDPSQFVAFVDTDQFVDVEFENDAQWYNYAATKISGLELKPLSFSKYAGFRAIANASGTGNIAEAVTLPEGLKIIVMHKDAIELLEQYLYTETLKGRGPWSVIHNHSKLGTYVVKTKPIFYISEAAVVAPTKG